MELNSEGPIAEQKVKGQNIDKVGAEIETLKRGQRRGSENTLKQPRQR